MRFDHNVIMSRQLGWRDFPVRREAINERIHGIHFNGGTPFAYCTLMNHVVVPKGLVFSFRPPVINIGPDFIHVCSDRSGYPDDLGGHLCEGGFTLHWGVYYG
ncbi:hypothetical protein EBL_c20380 [Shimwellia blattae DSM 4481 = NBRC 105725]|uniref:Uncharacterized protein n=1 Tax=Shimwellia blattae (strain ATCC 29907 / DSM 4481 / JCM 1650 / NBRC 105725 / CDC 9005-74) TaxID=630626 RepID=I2B9C5_SHIBC|nr:hypothetical protein EBL_c20380 [Shimwellia blattae DSM 4481 = NBRC 105725]